MGTTAMRVTCTTAYRSNVSNPIEETGSITVSAQEPEQTVTYATMRFRVRYWPGSEGESRNLKLWVTPTESNALDLEATLYQMAPTDRLREQPGGFGFTGLHYVYHPQSRAELQYSCQSQ
jgi:hypothetical protein